MIKRSAFCVLLSAEAVICSALACDPSVVIGSYPNAAAPDAGMLPEAGLPDATVVPEAGTGEGGATTMPPLPEAGPGGAGATSSEGGAGGAPSTGILLWSATHESGDVSDWEDQGGWYSTHDDPVASDVRAHGGQYALDFTIDTTDGAVHVARVYHETAAEPAYYSAWFFFEEEHVPEQWWAIFVFLNATDIEDENTIESLWDLNLTHTADGLFPYIYSHLTGENSNVGTVPVPIGEWVHLEFYFSYAPPDAGELRLWVNGEYAVEAIGLGEAPDPYIAFGLGNGSNGLTPNVSTIYIDDVAIARERRGPQ